jgi:hypothetical protein
MFEMISQIKSTRCTFYVEQHSIDKKWKEYND